MEKNCMSPDTSEGNMYQVLYAQSRIKFWMVSIEDVDGIIALDAKKQCLCWHQSNTSQVL